MGGAELLVSSWGAKVKTLPKNYVIPPHLRPKNFSISKDIPIIDLQQAEAGQGTFELIDQLMNAGQEFGMFQVINHGISEELMQEARSVSLDFFKMSDDEKEIFFTNDNKKHLRLYTSGHNYNIEDIHYWKDTFNLPCHPLEQHIQSWPEKPALFREVIGAYSGEVRKLSSRIMDLFCQGLGLEKGYFATDLSKDQGFLINHYPPCPEPSLALGIGPHCDAYLLTVIQQDAYGLQCTNKNGEWVGVDSTPNAFIVMVANQLEIISNGKLRSCVHRGVTNSEVDRISMVSFLSPDTAKVIGPATELLSPTNKPRYKSYKYIDFIINYMETLEKRDLSLASTLGPFQLQP